MNPDRGPHLLANNLSGPGQMGLRKLSPTTKITEWHSRDSLAIEGLFILFYFIFFRWVQSIPVKNLPISLSPPMVMFSGCFGLFFSGVTWPDELWPWKYIRGGWQTTFRGVHAGTWFSHAGPTSGGKPKPVLTGWEVENQVPCVRVRQVGSFWCWKWKVQCTLRATCSLAIAKIWKITSISHVIWCWKLYISLLI